MSSKSSFNFSSSISYSSSSSSNGQSTGSHQSHQMSSNPSGTTVKTISQKLGGPAYEETRQYDAQGRQLLEGASRIPEKGRITEIEDVTDEAAADERYKECMEDEYAKREGGA